MSDAEATVDERTRVLLREALPWIEHVLTRHSRTRLGQPGPPRVRTWATVVSIPATGGTVWFKAASHATAHEIALYPLLVNAAPDTVLHPLASDLERAWILLPDGGASLRQQPANATLVEHMVDLVPRYAVLQRELAPHVDAMRDLGVPDMRPARLPERFDEALAASSDIVGSRGTATDRQVLDRIRAIRPRFLEWSARLASSPIPASLDHSDLHDNNMLLPDGPHGPARVYDWGDSVIAHPFSSLLVLLRSLMDRLDTTPDDPRLIRVRDAYLEPFTDLAGRRELAELVDAACWTSVVIRSLCWARMLALGPPTDPDWITAPFDWMTTFLNDSWLD